MIDGAIKTTFILRFCCRHFRNNFKISKAHTIFLPTSLCDYTRDDGIPALQWNTRMTLGGLCPFISGSFLCPQVYLYIFR